MSSYSCRNAYGRTRTRLSEHGRAYLAVDSDIDGFTAARKAGYSVVYGDVSRRELIDRLSLDKAAAVVLTMDDPVLTARLSKRLRQDHPDLPIIARARDTVQAARLYKAGGTSPSNRRRTRSTSSV